MDTMHITSEDLRGWANAARECKPGWGQAFIADCWRVAKLLGATDLGLEAFKAAIVNSPDCRMVLRRLDLAGAFDAAQQAESEAHYGTSTVVHLVVR